MIRRASYRRRAEENLGTWVCEPTPYRRSVISGCAFGWCGPAGRPMSCRSCRKACGLSSLISPLVRRSQSRSWRGGVRFGFTSRTSTAQQQRVLSPTPTAEHGGPPPAPSTPPPVVGSSRIRNIRNGNDRSGRVSRRGAATGGGVHGEGGGPPCTVVGVGEGAPNTGKANTI